MRFISKMTVHCLHQYARLLATKTEVLTAWQPVVAASNGMYDDGDTVWLTVYADMLKEVLSGKEPTILQHVDNCWAGVVRRADAKMKVYDLDYHEFLIAQYSSQVLENAEFEDGHFNHFLQFRLLNFHQEAGEYQGM